MFGGGDCPESAIGGINLALESALPKSLVFVFTDATASDFKIDIESIDLIQKKQATVSILQFNNHEFNQTQILLDYFPTNWIL